MLLELNIRNFAIIEELNLELKKGFSVFTGETGAGKSILIGAIDLLLGDRANSDTIRTGADEAIIEGLFDIKPVKDDLMDFLEEAGISVEDELIIKRVIQKNGRNKIYINNTLTTLMTLTELGRQLLDIYGQSEHQSLTRIDEHIEILDSFADLLPLRAQMSDSFRIWRKFQRDLDQLTGDIKKAKEQRAELLESSREIADAALQEGMEEALTKEKNMLKNIDKMIDVTKGAENALYSNDENILSVLGHVHGQMQEIVKFDKKLEKVTDTLQSTMFELEEAATFIRDYGTKIQSNPQKREEVESKLDLIQKLKRKYDAATVKDLLKRKEQMDSMLSNIADHEVKRKDLEAKVVSFRAEADEIARKISETRNNVSTTLSSALVKELKDLGMNDVTFEVNVKAEELPDGTLRLGEKGTDSVSFFISTNKGEDVKPLNRIASGGELSRIMLAIKNLTSAGKIPTLIFDEVDAGVSGEVATMVARKLKSVSTKHQVIVITHLPQVAAFGEVHYFVKKEQNKEQRIVTKVHVLKGDVRVEGIARMIAGNELTDAAREQASLLLEEGAKS